MSSDTTQRFDELVTAVTVISLLYIFAGCNCSILKCKFLGYSVGPEKGALVGLKKKYNVYLNEKAFNVAQMKLKLLLLFINLH